VNAATEEATATPQEAPKALVGERWRGPVMVGDHGAMAERLCAVTLGHGPGAWPVAWVWYDGFGWSWLTEENAVDRERVLVAWARHAQFRAELAESDGRNDRDARQAYRAKWVAVLAALGLEHGEFDAVGAIRTLTRQRDVAEARLRDARDVIKALLAAAVPHPVEHPTMHAAWQRVESYLTALGSSYAPVGGTSGLPMRAWTALPAAQRQRVVAWLVSSRHDLELDREALAAEHGFDFVAAIEALVAWVTP